MPQVPARRRFTLARLLLVVLVFVTPLLGLEASVRVLIAAGRLPEAPAHFRDFEISWDNLRRLGRADVVVFGDSVAQQGIDPARLEAVLNAGPGRNVSVFNLASASGSFGINAALADQLVIEGRLPRVALIAIQPGILRDDLAFRGIFAPSPMGAEMTGCGETTTYDELANCLIGRVSAAWRWRGNLARVFEAATSPRPTTSRHGGLALREDGFRAGGGSSMPRLRAQLATNLSRTPVHVMLGSDALAGFLRLVEVLRKGGVSVIAVAVPNVPPLVDALEARNPAWEEEYRSAVAALGSAAGLRIIDPTTIRGWWSPSASRNIKHLSEAGASAFVDHLWSLPEFRRAIMGALDS